MNDLDLDTIQYPLSKPTLRLSVSEDPYAPQTGLQVPLDIYVERFQLSKILAGNAEPGARFGLFTYKLIVPEPISGNVGFRIAGRDGTSETPGGGKGGLLELYVEQISAATAESLRLEVPGGSGFSPVATMETENGENGGNAGPGGEAKVVYGSQVVSVMDSLNGISRNLGDKQKRWPKDFEGDAQIFLDLMHSDKVKESTFKLPDNVKTVADLLNSDFRSVFTELYRAVWTLDERIRAALTQATDVSPGNPGFGSKGKKTNGENGTPSTEGKQAVWLATLASNVLGCDVCYAHPLQCQMLLDKAKLLFFGRTKHQLGKAAGILERLRHKLAPFQEIPTGPEPALWKAYRQAEPRLFIPQGPTDKEPASVRQLRQIYIASTIILHQQLFSGKDLYGKLPNEVPGRSFCFYKQNVERRLGHLREIEEKYTQYANGDKAAATNLAAVEEKSELNHSSISHNQKLIGEAIEKIKTTAQDIEISAPEMKRDRELLLSSMSQLPQILEHISGVDPGDIISSLSQVAMAPDMAAPMAGLQVTGLLYRQMTNVIQDDGVPVKKDYMIGKLHAISDTIGSLTEGYQVLKNHGIQLDDPGKEKLLIQQKQWESLKGTISNALKGDAYKEANARFDKYIGMVEKRNAAILDYNASLALLLAYYHKRDELQADQKKLAQNEFASLDAGHPAMTAFLNKIYRENTLAIGRWLYEEQQAYRFLSLEEAEDSNIIGEKLEKYPSSQYNSTMLGEIQNALDEQYQGYLSLQAQGPQVFKGARYPLSPSALDQITDFGENGFQQHVTIHLDEYDFHGKYDVRITTVRFFAVGAKAKVPDEKNPTISDRLEVTLVHAGAEKFRNREGKVVEFIRPPVKATFKYELSTGNYDVRETTDGMISSGIDDQYAHVGPFTTWTINFDKTRNPQIDFSGLKSAFLEFDFTYRTV